MSSLPMMMVLSIATIIVVTLAFTGKLHFSGSRKLAKTRTFLVWLLVLVAAGYVLAEHLPLFAIFAALWTIVVLTVFRGKNKRKNRKLLKNLNKKAMGDALAMSTADRKDPKRNTSNQSAINYQTENQQLNQNPESADNTLPPHHISQDSGQVSSTINQLEAALHEYAENTDAAKRYITTVSRNAPPTRVREKVEALPKTQSQKKTSVFSYKGSVSGDYYQNDLVTSEPTEGKEKTETQSPTTNPTEQVQVSVKQDSNENQLEITKEKIKEQLRNEVLQEILDSLKESDKVTPKDKELQ